MRRITAILLIGIIAFQLAGAYVYFIGRLVSIRRAMRAELKLKPDHELTKLTFSFADYKKVQVEEDEIEVDGKMFDVARVLKQGDKLIVYALHDEAEDSLLSFLDELIKRSAHDKKPTPNQLSGLYSLQFISPIILDHTHINLPVSHYTEYMPTVSTKALAKIFLPPRN